MSLVHGGIHTPALSTILVAGRGFCQAFAESEVSMTGPGDRLCLSLGHVWQATGVPGWYRCIRSSKCRAVGVCSPGCVTLPSVPAGVELMACREHDPRAVPVSVMEWR